jgi:hypothetical protein
MLNGMKFSDLPQPMQAAFLGNARNSVESSDARVTHSTTPFSV